MRALAHVFVHAMDTVLRPQKSFPTECTAGGNAEALFLTSNVAPPCRSRHNPLSSFYSSPLQDEGDEEDEDEEGIALDGEQTPDMEVLHRRLNECCL